VFVPVTVPRPWVPLAAHVRMQSMNVVDHDILFSVVLVPLGNTPSSSDNVVLLDGVRLKSDDSAARVPCKGVVLLSFDNTYSRFRSKTVNYTTQVCTASRWPSSRTPTLRALNSSLLLAVSSWCPCCLPLSGRSFPQRKPVHWPSHRHGMFETLARPMSP
jgi:hypothetical protein